MHRYWLMAAFTSCAGSFRMNEGGEVHGFRAFTRTDAQRRVSEFAGDPGSGFRDTGAGVDGAVRHSGVVNG